MNKEELSVSEVLKSVESILKFERELHGGMMNRSFVMKDKFNNNYVLYIPAGEANSMVDRDIEHRVCNIYFNLGVSPQNFTFDEETGVKINEYIPGVSLNYVDPDEIDFNEVAKIIKAERNAPLIEEYYNPFERLLGYENERIGYGVQNTRNEYEILRKLVFDNRVILEKGKICLSHNDFQPSNIIASDRPDGKYYLIDFEFAMNNYEMYDIACFGNNNVKYGVKLLETVYENPKIKDYEAYYLWRMFISLQWYNVALIKDYHGEGEAHNIDFKGVASFFIDNALEAYNYLLTLKN